MSWHLKDWLKHLGDVAATAAPIIIESVGGPEAALISAGISTMVKTIHGVDAEQAAKVTQVLSAKPEYSEKLAQWEKILSDIMVMINREDIKNVA